MLKLTKFAVGTFFLAVIALFGVCFLNPSAAGRQAGIHGADGILQVAAVQANSMLRDASLQLPANMRGFSTTASAFVENNLATAKLQFKGMETTIAANVSGFGWLRPEPPSLQQATQDASIGAHNLARKMPVVNALRANMDHLSSLHPILSSANVGF